MPRLLSVLALIVLSTLPVVQASAADTDFACGLNAAYLFLNKAGHHVPYGELLREFEQQSPPNTLLAIKNVLGAHGCTTVGVKTDADFFLENKGPAIVHLQLSGYGPFSEDHFSYLVGASRQDGVELLDPLFNINSPARVTWGTFSSSYRGTALIPK